MSPILVRPVREQLEHDRVIRLLQAKFKRKHDVAINVGEERVAPVKVANGAFYPDLVLNDAERGRRLEGVVEVETGESVNHLEAMSEWATFGRARVPFYLYVPAGSVEVARRLCVDNHVTPAELWTYHSIGDQIRFTLIERSATPPPRPAKPAASRPAVASRRRTAARKAGTATPVAAASRRPNGKGAATPVRPKSATRRKSTATRRTAARRESSSRSSRSANAPRGGTASRRKVAPKQGSAKRKTGRR